MVIDNGGRTQPNRSIEERLARVETALEFLIAENKEIRQELIRLREDINAIRTTDFRLLFGALIFVTLGQVAIMAKGFGWI